MQIQKKHKFYAGLIGVALAAWAVDANFLRPSADGPRAASAAPVSSETADSSHPAQPVRNDGDLAGNWLAERLAAWGKQNPPESTRTRDIFSEPLSWGPQLSAPSTQPVTGSATTFRRDHHIAAVMVNPKGGSILIDGRLLRVGQSFGGCRLVGVAQGRADFVAPDGERFNMTTGPDVSSQAQ